MNQRHFPVIIEQDSNGVYIVSCPVFHGCHSYGGSIDEAIDNITEAIQVCLEDDNDSRDAAIQFVGIRDLELTL